MIVNCSTTSIRGDCRDCDVEFATEGRQERKSQFVTHCSGISMQPFPHLFFWYSGDLNFAVNCAINKFYKHFILTLQTKMD